MKKTLHKYFQMYTTEHGPVFGAKGPSMNTSSLAGNNNDGISSEKHFKIRKQEEILIFT
jgi:hypothetical protein